MYSKNIVPDTNPFLLSPRSVWVSSAFCPLGIHYSPVASVLYAPRLTGHKIERHRTTVNPQVVEYRRNANGTLSCQEQYFCCKIIGKTL